MTLHQIMWLIFIITASAMFFLDIKLSAKHVHEINRAEAFKLCFLWIAITLAFGLLSGFMLGKEPMVQFFTGYVIEYSLSMDNMFVFIIIFAYFGLPHKYQPKILTWGILGAVAMRLVLILAGVELLKRFHWLLYIFGAVLIFTAIKMAFQKESAQDPGKNPVLKLLGRFMPLEKSAGSGNFFIKKNERWHATSLLAALLVIETSDIIFAVDSIPAVLGISRDPFVVYTSNVFAVVGLRSLYFLLASVMELFRFLKPAVSIILCFVGVKMLGEHWFIIPPLVSLGVILGILLLSILLSALLPKKNDNGTSAA